MPRISRRKLLVSGFAVSTASLLGNTVWAESDPREQPGKADVGSPLNASTPEPREQLLFDFGWRFTFGHGADPTKDLGFGFGQSDFSKTGEFKFSKAGFDDSAWRTLDLPHDWAVELPFVHDDAGTGDSQLRSHGYKPLGRRYPETSVGWYRREFEIPSTDNGRRIWVEFDGVFRDALVFVNGCFIGRNNNGYVPFRFDLTDVLNYGGRNCLALRVDASFGDGWFYEGAGIYRDVWLSKTDPVHFEKWESVVRSATDGNAARLSLSTLVRNESAEAVNCSVRWKIFDARGAAVAVAESRTQSIAAYESAGFRATAGLANTALWSIEEPNLYSAVLAVEIDNQLRDTERVTFGVRTVVFDAAKGFFLNGKPLKIQGTCNHQDHAGVGAALPDGVQQFRLSVLRQMGCNAVRTSHNMPTPELVDACDRNGMMMMCETRQMSSNPEGMQQLATMIKRYRNSPSIILWSIENEERHLQNKNEMAEQGARMGASMVRLCHRLDPTRLVSAAVDGDNEQGVSVALDVIGFNYNLNLADEFHTKHPNRPVFGSETSSAVSTRGVYTTDKLRNQVSSVEGYWGTPEDWWSFYGEREWAAGGFAWTGFDYRGEPSPYGWPSISSQFGIVDTCGFPKDFFYYYKAWWRSEPSLHLFPHWNWSGREGDEIPVWVYTNLDEVELIVNGKSLGSKKVPRLGHVDWKVRFEPGAIEARGSRDGKMVLSEIRDTTGPVAALRLTSERNEVNADSEDVAILTVEALDSQGKLVPVADNQVSFEISGPAKLIGVGNGDPNCQESDKEPKRSLFNGLAQAIIQSTFETGQIQIEASCLGHAGARLSAKVIINSKMTKLRPAVPIPPRS
ncbi:MAG: beta-galactosidase GalA [Terracidiphilus sp.]